MVANGTILVFSVVANFFLGIFVYLKNPRRTINRLFCIYALTSSAWSASVFLGLISLNSSMATFWGRMACAIAVYMPMTFILFASVFPEGGTVQRKFSIYIGFVLASLMAIASFSENLVKVIEGRFPAQVTHYGHLIHFYTLFFVFGFGYAIFLLYRKIWKYEGIKRLQIQYLFFGILLSFCICGFIALIIPSIYGVGRAETYGPIASIVFLGFVGYAIARYKLMDITVVIKQTTVYAILISSLAGAYVVIVVVFESAFRGMVGYSRLLPSMVAAFLIALAFAPLKEAIQGLLERTVFRKKYDSNLILRSLSRILSSIFNIEDLLRLVLSHISEPMGLRAGAVYLEETEGTYRLKASFGQKSGSAKEDVSPKDPLPSALRRNLQLLVREEMELRPPRKESLRVAKSMRNLNAEVAIPIQSKDRFLGFITLGAKRSGYIFVKEDLDFFSALSHQLAVAIENSKLYSQVEESRKYQEILLNSLTSGVVAVDLEGLVTSFNRRAEEITGMKREDALGKNIRSLAPPLRNVLFDVLARQEAYLNRETRIETNGKKIPIGVSASLFRNPDGKPMGAFIIFNDLSEIKAMEAEVRMADRLASLGTLAAGMAHEIKNPLVSIKTFAQLLPGKFSDREFRESFSGLVTKEVNRINQIVERLLNFAKPSDADFRPLDPHAVIEETLNLLKREVEKRGVRIKRVFDANGALIVADSDHFKQICLNLILNSLQAMEHGGTLRLVTRRTRDPSPPDRRRIRRGPRRADVFPLKNNPERVRIEIHDTGTGIDPQDIPHLFDPFFTKRIAGTGLGLAIVHGIVEEHSGTISVRSEMGKGTTFTLAFPLWEPKRTKAK